MCQLGAGACPLAKRTSRCSFGFAGDIDELKLSLDGFDELAEAQRTAYTEQLKKDIGFQSMMNY